jgi:hypothetical protein
VHYKQSRPGRIPDGLSVVIINRKHERNNELWMMTNQHTFYSIKSNCMYAGKTVAVVNNFEGHMDNLYVTDSDRHLYSFLL